MATTTKSGYTNGSDLLLYVDGKAVGSCTSHTVTFNSETKDRAVKPVASKGIQSGLWKKKGVIGLSYSISAEGLRFYDETECGFKELFGLWKAGKSVQVKCMEREASNKPYLAGACVITSLEESAPHKTTLLIASVSKTTANPKHSTTPQSPKTPPQYKLCPK